MTSHDSTREEWKPAVGYPLHEVSNFGRVRSLPSTYVRREWRHQHQQVVHVGGNMLRGYVVKRNKIPMAVKVTIKNRDGERVAVRVHRLVLEAFIGPCPDGFEGCHNDGNPENNQLDNLRWDTHLANVADCVRHGRKTPPPYHAPGETHPRAKLTDAQVRLIRAMSDGRGVAARLAKEYAVAHITIRRIRNGYQRQAVQ